MGSRSRDILIEGMMKLVLLLLCVLQMSCLLNLNVHACKPSPPEPEEPKHYQLSCSRNYEPQPQDLSTDPAVDGDRGVGDRSVKLCPSGKMWLTSMQCCRDAW